MFFAKNILLAGAGLAAAVTADWTTETYDAIIVGSGPAGIIVATRMAEAGLQTLLLEAGGPSFGITGGELEARRPTWLAGTTLSRVDVPGLYKSIYSSNDGLTCSLNSYGGCTVGGGSAVNAGLFFKPPASDWDVYFPEGWHSADVETANQRLNLRQTSTDSTSQDGVRYLQTGYDAARKWLVDGLGFKDGDMNAQADEKTEVFGRTIFDYANGQRGGPVVSYLQSALQQSNFQIQTNVTVLRVERSLTQATGVYANISGVEKVISLNPNGRVILSSGAIQSPKLLMMSGIGDPAVLSKIQAAGKMSTSLQSGDWINSTAVGTGLFDNPNTFIELEGPSIQSYVYSYESPVVADAQAYVNNRSGPYTFASETSVFFDTLTRDDGSNVTFQGTIDSSGYTDYLSNNTITLNIYGTSGILSKGSVVLDESANFAPGPDGNIYYSNPTDAENIAGWIYKLFQALPDSGLTPLNIAQNSTEAEIQTYITTASTYADGSVNHWSSSCRIGECVDNQTRVIGMDNLHVVDASIVAPLSVNPQYGIMVAAEKASELILALFGKTLDATSY
ncbi:Cellobiose dehydrogenase [Lachnellula occidentalis]|uniref:Cellobiose dehydrogenase n=1 Tax=Lachnellula occidentalis TaxID=215460 RepID=A0A8H8U979_9HELO|nr:Cellobiose dehydrogenase [Lachnellula occidentalis]